MTRQEADKLLTEYRNSKVKRTWSSRKNSLSEFIIDNWKDMGYSSPEHFLECLDARIDTETLFSLWCNDGIVKYSQALGGRP